MSTITIFTTGGTIDKVYYDALSTYQVGDSAMDSVLRDARVTLKHRVTPLMRKDSLELTDADRSRIVDAVGACDESRIVITHGTDTMTETATAIAASVSDKVVVLTGALAPALFRETDAAFNVGMAIGAAQTLAPGVYIAMNGQIFDARHVRKDRAANQFVSTAAE